MTGELAMYILGVGAVLGFAASLLTDYSEGFLEGWCVYGLLCSVAGFALYGLVKLVKMMWIAA